METYRFVEGPLLKQILTQRQVMIPITMKIRVVTINPIFYFDDLTNCHGPRHKLFKILESKYSIYSQQNVSKL